MTGLNVGGVTPLTTIDFPGELSTVVFCQGCPWRCRYCQNAHLLARDVPAGLAWQEVLDFLERRRGLLDAVVFSGGEPTLQRDLPAAVAAVKALGFKVGLHTAGCYPDRLAAVIPQLDWVGLDIKAMPGDYPALTGVPGSGERAWESLERVVGSGVAHEVRITAHDRLLSRRGLAALIRRVRDAGAAQVVVQRCRTDQLLDPGLGENSIAWPTGQRSRVV